MLKKSRPARAPGTAVFLTSDPDIAPVGAAAQPQAQPRAARPQRHRHRHVATTPRVPDAERLAIEQLDRRLQPRPADLRLHGAAERAAGAGAGAQGRACSFEMMSTSYFLNRRSFRPSPGSRNAALAGQALHRDDQGRLRRQRLLPPALEPRARARPAARGLGVPASRTGPREWHGPGTPAPARRSQSAQIFSWPRPDLAGSAHWPSGGRGCILGARAGGSRARSGGEFEYAGHGEPDRGDVRWRWRSAWRKAGRRRSRQCRTRRTGCGWWTAAAGELTLCRLYAASGPKVIDVFGGESQVREAAAAQPRALLRGGAQRGGVSWRHRAAELHRLHDVRAALGDLDRVLARTASCPAAAICRAGSRTISGSWGDFGRATSSWCGRTIVNINVD